MDYQQALNKCMDLCSRREYCVFDIQEKLHKWEVSHESLKKILTALIQQKFIDESRYCQAFVTDKFRFNHWGKTKIKYYLKHKQISESTIQSALECINPEAYQQTIREEIQKKQKSVKAKTLYEKQGKIAQSLIAKGFEPALVFELLKNEA